MLIKLSSQEVIVYFYPRHIVSIYLALAALTVWTMVQMLAIPEEQYRIINVERKSYYVIIHPLWLWKQHRAQTQSIILPIIPKPWVMANVTCELRACWEYFTEIKEALMSKGWYWWASWPLKLWNVLLVQAICKRLLSVYYWDLLCD